MTVDQNKGGPISRCIEACAKSPVWTLFIVFILTFWGYYSLKNTPLDAIPDLSDVQVIVLTEWPGRSPDLIEDQITYPISSEFLSIPKIKFVRGQSVFGLSFVYVIFEDGTDLYWARSRVLEYLNTIKSSLPEGVTPVLGPDATGVGWVYSYAVVDETGNHDLQELRSIQDWNIRYALRSVPGVSEVASIGGFIKQYQVNVDPNKLRAYGISLDEVIQAVKQANENTGGDVIEVAEFEYMIKGSGYVHNTREIEEIALRVSGQEAPLFVKDVAVVNIGPDLERGIADLNGEGNVAGGIVVMRYGENALRVIDGVKAKLNEVQKSLPEGVKIQTTYDRSELIKGAVETLTRTLIEEMIVVSIVIFIFLLQIRSSLVLVLTIPIGVILAFIPMFYQGLTANIMSLGGIAVAIGAMIDGGIIIIENLNKRLEAWEAAGRPGDRFPVIVEAMKEVGPSIFFSLLVITVSFTPIFMLEGTEGRLFKPLAFTNVFSIGFAAILAVTLIPALAALFVRGYIAKEEKNPLNRWLIAAYIPIVRLTLQYKRTVIVVAALVTLLTIPIWLRLGEEFMPPLNEGTLLYMPTAPPGLSITEATSLLQSMDREIHKFPEVETVFGKMGRASTATDPAPISMAEITIVLKPKDQWRKGVTWDSLVKEMDEKLQFPGLSNIWWMPIQTRTEMLATGIRSPIGVLVYGDDIKKIEQTAIAIEHAISKIPGTRSAYAERSVGAYYIDYQINRQEAARYGLRVKDIQDVITSAVGGMNISQTIEGRERYPINVRYAKEFRDDPPSIDRIFVTSPTGAQIPLSQVATPKFIRGPDMIRSQEGKLVGYVFVDNGSVPLADYVAEAKRAVAADVSLEKGMLLDWAGQFTYLERAKEKLMIVVPLTLLLVFLLIYLNTQSFVETGIVLLAVPFSLVGAIWLLYLLDYNMSVAVWVGLIALAGLDAQTGVIMLLYLKLSYIKHKQENKLNNLNDLQDAVIEGAAKRIRPKLMTVVTMMIGLFPLLWSTGTGADVMKRIAAPMVGGLVTSFILNLLVYPPIFFMWKERRVTKGL
ncbi:MAG: CusA/CzcA family heavy metal efflux RND transporter [Chlamydiales bacterium]|nr:CusA/CzcA family heavy metal efflux RND transporter [Chlamydiales bacterium]